MKHIDAQAALDNQFLMQLFDEAMEMGLTNIEAADNQDDLTRFEGVVQRRVIRSILEQLQEACKVQN